MRSVFGRPVNYFDADEGGRGIKSKKLITEIFELKKCCLLAQMINMGAICSKIEILYCIFLQKDLHLVNCCITIGTIRF